MAVEGGGVRQNRDARTRQGRLYGRTALGLGMLQHTGAALKSWWVTRGSNPELAD